MSGYENLIAELLKEYHPNKIATNERFIQAIVRILAENPEDRVALEMAEKERDEAEDLKRKSNAILKDAERREREAEKKEREVEERIKHAVQQESKLEILIKRVEKVREEIKACETPEARDKMRLANLFRSECSRGSDGLAYVRGLSNILGNGGRKPESKEEATEDESPVLGFI